MVPMTSKIAMAPAPPASRANAGGWRGRRKTGCKSISSQRCAPPTLPYLRRPPAHPALALPGPVAHALHCPYTVVIREFRDRAFQLHHEVTRAVAPIAKQAKSKRRRNALGAQHLGDVRHFELEVEMRDGFGVDGSGTVACQRGRGFRCRIRWSGGLARRLRPAVSGMVLRLFRLHAQRRPRFLQLLLQCRAASELGSAAMQLLIRQAQLEQGQAAMPFRGLLSLE
ncbi:MAG: hypothetical protein DKINENOH_04819 [bacterium]|nr:hypothetical protein [bacterium]